MRQEAIEGLCQPDFTLPLLYLPYSMWSLFKGMISVLCLCL